MRAPLRNAIWSILLALPSVFLPAIAAADAAPRRPNFLFIYTDDQRWDALSVVQREQGEKGRFPWLHTPHMDRVAAEGVRFRNAFVVNSLCAPSRASFLTGVYGYRNGIVNNHTPFPVENVTYASLLKQAGYVTGYVGKFHMDNQRGQRPGFDFSASFIGQGRYFDCPIEVNGQETPSKGWVDDVSTDYALSFLRTNREKPFALAVGFKATHGPFAPRRAARMTTRAKRLDPCRTWISPRSTRLLLNHVRQPADRQGRSRRTSITSAASRPPMIISARSSRRSMT